ncbi:MAG: phage holin family protein [Actinomycetota bacterium]|nr:phage holin family protein [Nitrospiraceae bacterium]MDA8157192.1 phage holin family protein [Actinomycetota bacterium]
MSTVREHSIGELFRDLAGQTRALFKEEIELARIELSEKAVRAAKDAGAVFFAAAFLFTGFLALIACAIAAISIALQVWLSALVIGAFFLIAGVFILAISIDDIKKGKLKPNRTIDSFKKTRDTLKEDVPWLKKTKAPEPEKKETSSEVKANGKKMDEVEEELDTTRSGMHTAIGEIEEKLSPPHLAHEAAEQIRQAGAGLKKKMLSPTGGWAGKAASKAFTLAKGNPFPVFVAGVGISWLITKGARRKMAGGAF